MVRIEHSDLDKIAKKYFDEIKVDIKLRCEFLNLILDVLFNGVPFIDLLNFPDINWKTKHSIVNQFLQINKLARNTHYVNVVHGNAHPWVAVNNISFRGIATFLRIDAHLEELILCSPDDAFRTQNDFIAAIGLPNPLSTEVKKILNIIIDYSLFDKYAYGVAQKLNINTCPYCNRNYINTVIDKKGKHIIRPTFDHFFPQKYHPFLALSFYNLIPSCYYCNSSLKSSANVHIDTHIHPYKEGFDNDATFQVLIKTLNPKKSDPENYSLLISDKMVPHSISDRYRKIFGGTRSVKNLKEGNVSLFKLEVIYQSHLDIVGELRVKTDKLNSWYGKSIVKMFPLLGTNVEEFYQYYFGNYFNEKDFHRRPMAKLTKDVVSQMIPNFSKK